MNRSYSIDTAFSSCPQLLKTFLKSQPIGNNRFSLASSISRLLERHSALLPLRNIPKLIEARFRGRVVYTMLLPTG